MIRERMDTPVIILRLIEAIHFPWKTKEDILSKDYSSNIHQLSVIDRLYLLFSASMKLTLVKSFSKAS